MGSEPYWFLALAAVCVLAVLYMVPDAISQRLHSVFIDSPAAKNVTALAALVGFAVVLFTALQIKLDLDDREAERGIRRDEAIDRAWTRLLERAGGNTGKGGALSTLHREGIFLNAIDLSCRAVGDFDFATNTCRRTAIFGDIVIDGDFDDGKMTAATLDFAEGYLERPIIENAFLMHIGMDRAMIFMPNIHGSVISVTGGHSTWNSGSIRDSSLSALPGATIGLQDMDVSGSELEGFATGAIQSADGSLFYWADWPPLEVRMVFQVGPGANVVLRPELREKMQACRPPAQQGSEATLAKQDRPALSRFSCSTMSATEAAAAYPEAYPQAQP
jgi:hypothetical protein